MQRDARLPPSLWADEAAVVERPERRALRGDLDVDVAIVGAGYTGLWTAYYLAMADPHLRVAILEREIVGFGASGRNGGWCSAISPVGLDQLDHLHGPGTGRTWQRTLIDTVDEVLRVCDVESIDAQAAKGGWLELARSEPQVERLRHDLDKFVRHGFGDDDRRWLSPHEARERLGATGVLGAAYTPHCAAIQPARLTLGLAAAVERLGVTIYECTPVSHLEPGCAVTSMGRVRADMVVVATEAYTKDLPGRRRHLLPIYSLMVATEPIPEPVWAEIGLGQRETFNDARREVIYGQRTADGRIAFGGRGAPYHYGSAIEPRFDQHARVRDALVTTLRQLFPVLGGVEITHHWGGPLGATRDWHPFVHVDRSNRLAAAGGYVGDGVATSNLAGRTLADLVLGRPTDLTAMAWVGHHSRRWEPEPLRWLAVNAALRVAAQLDRLEPRAGRTARKRGSWRAAALDRLTGG